MALKGQDMGSVTDKHPSFLAKHPGLPHSKSQRDGGNPEKTKSTSELILFLQLKLYI